MDNNVVQIVIAIDIGTTYSGFAFSTGLQFKDKPANIYTKLWNSTLSRAGKTV